jgi:hypothetical protein
MNSINLIRIFQVLFFYLVIAHLIACMWVEVSHIEDNEYKSWLRRLPVPRPTGTRQPGDISLSNDTIYKHAIYWAIVTVSHIGVGDITAITVNERAFNCFVVLMGTFIYAILFGNMASLVSDLSS